MSARSADGCDSCHFAPYALRGWTRRRALAGAAAFGMAPLFGCTSVPPIDRFRPEDRRRAVPNHDEPPKGPIPSGIRAPLDADRIGTIRRVETQEKVCAFTFDLCELAVVTTGYDARSIGILRREGIPASLFLGGKWMRTHAERTKELMADPLFEIGNHAWAHGNFGIMTKARMLEEIRWTDAEWRILRQEALEEARRAGRPAPAIPEALRFFRLPYGRCSTEALKLLAAEGLDVVQWTLGADSVDEGSPAATGRRIAKRIRPGDIMLFHANLVPKHDAEILLAAADALREEGFRFLKVSDLLRCGRPVRILDGYFEHPGDNLSLDGLYGVDGTGRRRAKPKTTA